MKQYLLSIVLLLNGCVVADMDSSNYTTVPYVQVFQKADTIGHTDHQQRKRDLYDCGVDKSVNLDDGKWSRSDSTPQETLQELVARTLQVEHCMESKGYIVFSYGECGPLKKPTGKCN
ncbi:hypothetical protein AGJ34_18570 [Cronobacter dublinensis subsp. dublinensis]|nr:hypothetical protein [Cronobacter dublinensis subsp. dublinensis]EGT5667456.1 hypothetical protein [Cronobacter dublinensis subsp. dublinensis]EGT5674986.1 hypothetical protein [Cronobacter dublinensis subsp. dublinensis]EGT5678912.1 hypothetical protein [Cronobacter dublinensis subsp. dublinensis]EGT5685934.1 hypothetical protein [Cronobacter dublinensis subsp. dublinensis]